MGTHSSVLAWRIPWTEEPDRLQSIGSQRPMTRLKGLHTNTHTHTHSLSLSFSLVIHRRSNWGFNQGGRSWRGGAVGIPNVLLVLLDQVLLRCRVPAASPPPPLTLSPLPPASPGSVGTCTGTSSPSSQASQWSCSMRSSATSTPPPSPSWASSRPGWPHPCSPEQPLGPRLAASVTAVAQPVTAHPQTPSTAHRRAATPRPGVCPRPQGLAAPWPQTHCLPPGSSPTTALGGP